MESKSGPNSDLNVNKDDTKMYCDICETLRLCFEGAKSYCTICTHFLCDECKETHEKCPGLKDHELLFGEDMPTGRIEKKIITRYRRIGYNLNVMRQSACLVFNPITVDNYAAFFNCTPVGRASDSMMAPT